MKVLALVLAAAAAMPLSPLGSSAANMVVDTEYGPVEGYEGAEGVRIWKGVRFGAPTDGENRFRSPQPPAPWTEVLPARRPGNACPGTIQALFQFIPLYNQSEDCLFLNVYSPPIERVNGTLVPVMFWIYGGAFFLGDGWEFGIYNGENVVVTQDVVIVTVNYRLGPLGFLVLEDTLRGNYGLEDQRFGMQWVKRNIAKFGGDPDRITIYGESAGAMSVSCHLTSPLTPDGLFHNAIMQSAPSLNYKTNAQAASLGEGLSKKLECWDAENMENTLLCLRSLPWVQFARVAFPYSNRFEFGRVLGDVLAWGPTVDGVNMLETPIAAFSRGAVKNVPVVVGNNREETALFSQIVDVPLALLGVITGENRTIELSDAAYRSVIALIFQDSAPQVLQRYPPIGENWDYLFDGPLDDYLWVCPTRVWSRGVLRAGQPAYAYQFNHPAEFARVLDPSESVAKCRRSHVCHATDLFFMWNVPGFGPIQFAYSPEERVLSETMINYWVAHAYGNVNGRFPSVPQWPGASSGLRLFLDVSPAGVVPESFPDDLCDFWDSTNYIY